MAYSQLVRLEMEAARELAFGSITSTYMGIGAALDKPVRMIFIQNMTDASLWFSMDGVNNHFPLPSEGFLLLDVTANKTREQGYYIAEGTRFYVKELQSPTEGSVYLTTMYGGE